MSPLRLSRHKTAHKVGGGRFVKMAQPHGTSREESRIRNRVATKPGAIPKPHPARASSPARNLTPMLTHTLARFYVGGCNSSSVTRSMCSMLKHVEKVSINCRQTADKMSRTYRFLGERRGVSPTCQDRIGREMFILTENQVSKWHTLTRRAYAPTLAVAGVTSLPRDVLGDLLRAQRPVVDRGFVEAAFEAEGLVVAAAEEELPAACRYRDLGVAFDFQLAVEVDRDLLGVAHQGDVAPLPQLQRRLAD